MLFLNNFLTKTPSHPPITPIMIIKKGSIIISAVGKNESGAAALEEELVSGRKDEPEDVDPKELNMLAIWLIIATAANHNAPIRNPKLIIDTKPRKPPFAIPSE